MNLSFVEFDRNDLSPTQCLYWIFKSDVFRSILLLIWAHLSRYYVVLKHNEVLNSIQGYLTQYRTPKLWACVSRVLQLGKSEQAGKRRNVMTPCRVARDLWRFAMFTFTKTFHDHIPAINTFFSYGSALGQTKNISFQRAKTASRFVLVSFFTRTTNKWAKQ